MSKSIAPVVWVAFEKGKPIAATKSEREAARWYDAGDRIVRYIYDRRGAIYIKAGGFLRTASYLAQSRRSERTRSTRASSRARKSR